MISVILFKMSKRSDFHLIFFEIEGAWQDFTVLGDAFSKLETFVWILNRISSSITWSLFTLKASYLVKWPISTWSFMWWCQFIEKLKFKTRLSSLMNFGTANGNLTGLLSLKSNVLWIKLTNFAFLSYSFVVSRRNSLKTLQNGLKRRETTQNTTGKQS